jgi:hypothetical protein
MPFCRPSPTFIPLYLAYSIIAGPAATLPMRIRHITDVIGFEFEGLTCLWGSLSRGVFALITNRESCDQTRLCVTMALLHHITCHGHISGTRASAKVKWGCGWKMVAIYVGKLCSSPPLGRLSAAI